MPTLEWMGKDKVINHHLEVPYRVLEHQYTYVGKRQTKEEFTDGNKIIRGDNLEALKALLPQYEGKIKCIYIDPPYNTGNEGWVYNDNVNDPKIIKWLGEVVGREGEDLSRHDKWLCMMYPRLKLLQRLLADDGAIFISIDDAELANLRLICDEIFGANNFIDTVIWEKRYSPQNAVQWFSESHDFIIVYAKNKEQWHPNLLNRTDEMNARYRNLDNDTRGIWKPTDSTAQAGHGTDSQFYVLTAPNGKEHHLPNGRCWVYTKEVMNRMIAENRVWFGNSGNNMPAIKRFLSDVKKGMSCKTIWPYQEVGHNQEAKKEIKAIFPESIPFDTPKPTRLMERILHISTDPNSLILDSFAGSGTTAHAVLNMNKSDGGNRKFILVEMMDYAENITAERVRRVIDGYGEGRAAVEGTGGSFGFYELGEALLNADQTLNERIPVEKIRQYVFFMETKQPMGAPSETEPYQLGSYMNAAYYFYYEKDRITTLNHDFLSTLQTQAEGYVIYADLCVLSDEELKQYVITYKKIPRDISRL